MEVQDKLYWLFTQGLIANASNNKKRNQEVDCDNIKYSLRVKNKSNHKRKVFVSTNYNKIINDAYEWANKEERKMRIENLEVLHTYKNYNELCKALGISNTRGNTKKANLKELERYCEFSTEGQNITIIEIYDKPILKTAKENSVFIRPLELLLLHYLLKQEGDTVKNTNNDWYEYIGLCSVQYNQTRKALKTKNKEIISELPIVQNSSYLQNTPFENWLFLLGKIVDCTSSKLFPLFTYTLKSMANRGLITEYGRPYILIDKFGNHNEATKEQRKMCLDCIGEVLEEMKTDLKKVNSNPRARMEYYEKINEKISLKTKERYKGFYQITEILFSKNGIKRLLDKIDVAVEKNNFQQSLCARVIKQIKNDTDKINNLKEEKEREKKEEKEKKKKDIKTFGIITHSEEDMAEHEVGYVIDILFNIEDLTKSLIID